MRKAEKHHISHAALFAVVCLTVLAGTMFARGVGQSTYENIVYALNPTAERAYWFGLRRFDEARPATYDLNRAEYFLREAVRQDPKYPHVYHQLARISFLRGDFERALQLVTYEIEKGSGTPHSYYIRGLVKGYKDDFAGAALDYEKYLAYDPNNWAALNDYAWVLLKDDRPRDALVAIEQGLVHWPENPWLLNSKAATHFELGELGQAKGTLEQAQDAVAVIRDEDWLRAYPGNDPLIAADGVRTFQQAIEENIHTISLALNIDERGVQ